MGAIAEQLRAELANPEFSEGYAEGFLDAYVATQIKVLREQREMTQRELAEKIGSHQTVISRVENVGYSGWNVGTLKKLARAFGVRLKISFEQYGSLPDEVEAFSRGDLQRLPRHADPGLIHDAQPNEQEAARLRAIIGNVTQAGVEAVPPISAVVSLTLNVGQATDEERRGQSYRVLPRRASTAVERMAEAMAAA